MDIFVNEDQLVLTYKGWRKVTNLKFLLIPMPIICLFGFIVSVRESWIFPWWVSIIWAWGYMAFSIIIADQIYNREWIFNKIDNSLKLYHKRPKYYCNFVPSFLGFGPKMGLLEEFQLETIKTVSLERKKFDFYGELTRYIQFFELLNDVMGGEFVDVFILKICP